MDSTRKPTIVAGGFRLPEGCRWHEGALWFVDMLKGNVHRLADHAVEHVASYGRPSSLGFRPNGDMLIADASTSRLHTYRDRQVVATVDLSDFGSINDMTVDATGRAYIGGRFQRAGSKDFEPLGYVVVVPVDGNPRIVADGIIATNGIGVCPDSRTLLVGASFGPNGSLSGAELYAFNIENDGSLSDRRVAATIDRGSVDGLCVDAEGAVWICTASGNDARRYVDGEIVDRVPLPDGKWALACALGGPDQRTLYLCTAAAPLKGDPDVFPGGWNYHEFHEAWIETVEVDVPGFSL
jgi:sugar lactone lactonase YvrE